MAHATLIPPAHVLPPPSRSPPPTLLVVRVVGRDLRAVSRQPMGHAPQNTHAAEREFFWKIF